MADFTYREWFELPPRLLLPPPMSLAVPAAMDAICSLFRAYPAEMGALISDSGLPSGATPYILNRACPVPEQPPPDPRSPFNGGQGCFLYDVTVVSTVDGFTSTNVYSARPGRIRGLVYEESAGDPNLFSGSFVLETGYDCPNATPERVVVAGGQNMQTRPTAAITSVVRSDGNPDNDGNPPPLLIPGNPPPGAFAPTITVQNDGDSITYPVTLIPNEPPGDYYSRPQVSFSIGDQITITLDGEGFTIGYPPNSQNPGSPVASPLPPGQSPPPVSLPPLFPYGGNGAGGENPGGGGGGGGGNCPDVDLTPVLEAIVVVRSDIKNLDDDVAVVSTNVEELLDCDRCSRPSPEECRKLLATSGQSGEIGLDKTVAWVGLELVVIPSNAKTQWGVSGPDVFFCGWKTFGGAGKEGDRTPISYELNIFPVLEGASGFSFTLLSGYQANVFVYLKPE